MQYSPIFAIFIFPKIFCVDAIRFLKEYTLSISEFCQIKVRITFVHTDLRRSAERQGELESDSV